MEVIRTPLPGLLQLKAVLHKDNRGHFVEAFNTKAFLEAGIDLVVLQHNISRSKRDVVRGLHFQWDKPLAKLIRVARGKAFLVAADIRKGSPTFGKWYGTEVSEEDAGALYAPAGFATGFAALTDNTEIEYYYSAFYNKEGESNIRFDDPDLNISWPAAEPILSERDLQAESFKAWCERPESDLFEYPSK